MSSEFAPIETVPPFPSNQPTKETIPGLLDLPHGLVALAPAPMMDAIAETPMAWVPDLTEGLNQGSPAQTAQPVADPLLEWAPLQAVWQEAQHKLDEFMQAPQSQEALTFTFGEAASTPLARAFIEQVIDQQQLPKLSVLPQAELAAQGAYAAKTDTIFLAKELFGQPEKLLRVFLEELGHFLDDRINAVDAAGDEGALFAAHVMDDFLTTEDVASLKGENDAATLTIGDQTLQVEQADGLGVFTVSSTGPVTVEFLVDSGLYRGQVAIFSLSGMEGLVPGSVDFIREAARRSLSNSAEGYVVIDDIGEGASLSGELAEGDRNSGPPAGAKTIAFAPGTQLAIMLVPEGTVAEVLENPAVEGSTRPLFSIASANPNGQIHIGQTRPGVFALEDLRFDAGSDADFNDVIFSLQGADGPVESVTNLIGSHQVWLDTPLGRQLFLIPADVPGGSDNPLFPPPDPATFQSSIPTGVAKFTAGDSEAAIAASGAARITIGTQTIYIGTNQVSSINQNPIIASFDSANPANNWVRTDYEVTGADGRGLGIAWDGSNLYAVFSVDGTQGTSTEDFRRAAADAQQAWLRSYGQGGGPKVSVLGRIDPATGELLDAAYLSAILSNGNSNSLSINGLTTNASGNLVVSAQSFFSPRRPDGTALTQITPGSSPFAYIVEITPDLKRVVNTAADGWA